jgi:hypothetical protein
MAGCPACSAPTDPIDRFCGRCGSGLLGVAAVDPGLSRFCHGCGGSLEPDAHFCRSCGAQAPEPVENVFVGMDLGGHDVVTITEPVAGLAAQNPPVRVAPPRPSRPKVRRPTLRPAMDQARTETIRRPSASPALPDPAPETAGAGPRGAAQVATATIERTPVRRTALVPEAQTVLVPEADEDGLRTRESGFPWGGTLALLGGLTVILSAIVDWGGPFAATLPRDISAAWLLDPAVEATGPSLGVVLLLLGTVGALVTLVGMAVPGFTFLRRFVGLVTLMFPLGFVLRTIQELSGSGLLDVPSAIGLGVVMAAAGALLQFVARRPRRGIHA